MNCALVGGGLAGLVVLAAIGFAHAQQQVTPPPKGADRAKETIEVGTKAVVAPAPVPPPAPANLADFSKKKQEGPTETVLAEGFAEAATQTNAPRDFVNPKVQPGRVNWHKDFAAACAAAARSGKPVLLFQMMGKLDDQFC